MVDARDAQKLHRSQMSGSFLSFVKISVALMGEVGWWRSPFRVRWSQWVAKWVHTISAMGSQRGIGVAKWVYTISARGSQGSAMSSQVGKPTCMLCFKGYTLGRS